MNSTAIMSSSSSSFVPSRVVAGAAAVLMLLHRAPTAHSFVVPPSVAAPSIADAGLLPRVTQIDSAARRSTLPHASSASAAMSSTSTASESLSLTLEKPLGLILEEDDGEGVGGVIVTEVNEGGSAFESPSKDRLIQAKIGSVMGLDVSTSSFDDVMDAIINAPSPVDIDFAVVPASPSSTGGDEEVAEAVVDETPRYEMGTPVAITVQQPETNKPDIILDARVGDNLRKTLLANGDIELYRGLKKKLGNCGGGGQCGFCAVELVDEGEGVWGERSDYEAQRIGRNGNEKCRLACMNNIVGPATVRTL